MAAAVVSCSGVDLQVAAARVAHPGGRIDLKQPWPEMRIGGCRSWRRRCEIAHDNMSCTNEQSSATASAIFDEHHFLPLKPGVIVAC
jgi:hypothetical protein